MIFGYKHVGGNYSQFTTGPVALNNIGKVHSAVITTSQIYRSVTSTTTISTGKYYHVVLNKDTVNGTLELYINGQLESTNTFDTFLHSKNILTLLRESHFLHCLFLNNNKYKLLNY